MTLKKQGVLTVTGSAVALFWSAAFMLGLPGVMGAYWQEMFNVGRGAIGNTLFFVLAGSGTSMFVAGLWQERFGTRRLMTAGTILAGLDMFLLGYVSNIFMLYLWAFLTGFAQCLIYVPALTTAQHWFPSTKGLVSGVINSTVGLSAAGMSPVFSYMLIFMGYHSMIIVLGALALAVGTVAAQFAKMPPTVHEQQQPMVKASARQPILLSRSITLNESIRTGSFWCLWCVWALQGAAGIGMVTLSTQFGSALGLPLPSAVAILTGFNLWNGISRFLTGYLSDIVGRTKIMSLTFFAAGAAYFGLPHVTSLIVAVLLASVIGFAFGTLFAVSPPLTADCFGLAHFGAIFGLLFSAFGLLAGPLGPSLGGYVLDATDGNFAAVFAYLGLFCVTSGILVRFVIPPKGWSI